MMIQMTIGANVLVDIGPDMASQFPAGATGLTGTHTLTPAHGAQPFMFTMRRVANAGGGMVNLAVVDACGTWRTIAGGGVNAF